MKKLVSAFAASTVAFTMVGSAFAFPAPTASAVARACAGLTGPGRSRCTTNSNALQQSNRSSARSSIRATMQAIPRPNRRLVRQAIRGIQEIKRVRRSNHYNNYVRPTVSSSSSSVSSASSAASSTSSAASSTSSSVSSSSSAQ